MPITGLQAIEAVRRFAEARHRSAWRTVEISGRKVVAGHDCWRVTARGSHRSTEPDCWGETDDWTAYMVDVEDGACIGVEVLAGTHLFIPVRSR